MDNGNENTVIAEKIAKEVAALGGTVYYVGGYVRDRLRNIENKDIDLEVHGIHPSRLEAVLDSLGQRISVGESFGVYRLKGYNTDIAIPRKEAVRGIGHKDFDISVDPFLGTLKAAERRDFTVNAIMQNVLSGELIDHFDGQSDLGKGIVRHVNPYTFTDDALRVLRAAQFAARFDFTVAPETVKLCSTMELSFLAKERVFDELKKALLKADRPSVFFETLREMNQLEPWFGEIKDLINTEQDDIHHQEGDVWNHTMLVLDNCAKYRNTVQNPLGFMLSALTHDLGKVICSERIGNRVHAYGHEYKGLPLVRQFLKRLTDETALIKYVSCLVENHMRPNILAEAGSSVKATNRMFDRCKDPEALVYLSVCDSLSSIASPPHKSNEMFLSMRLMLYREYMSQPYITGRDLIDAGLSPDKSFSEVLDYAHKLRLAGVDKDSALKQTLIFARKRKES